MKKIYGIRICRSCKGICHENSYRRNFGLRRIYWCSKNCLEWKITKEVGSRIPKKYKHLIDRKDFIEQAWLDTVIKDFYEKVDVITK